MVIKVTVTVVGLVCDVVHFGDLYLVAVDVVAAAVGGVFGVEIVAFVVVAKVDNVGEFVAFVVVAKFVVVGKVVFAVGAAFAVAGGGGERLWGYQEEGQEGGHGRESGTWGCIGEGPGGGERACLGYYYCQLVW